MSKIALGTWAWGAGAFGGDAVFGSVHIHYLTGRLLMLEALKGIYKKSYKIMKQFIIAIAMLILPITAVAQGNEIMIVRLAEIEVYPQYLKEYLEFANEVDRLSVEREPGVVCLFPMQSTEDSCLIRILEIYASEEAYQLHLKTDHFQKYKQGTLHMVKDLKLPTMKPLDPETMKQIFKKQR